MYTVVESSEGFESSQEVVPETQIAGEAQPYSAESSQGRYWDLRSTWLT